MHPSSSEVAAGVADQGQAPSQPAAATSIYAPPTCVRPPVERPLKVYAFDPSAGRLVGNYMTVNVRYETLQPGPIGKRFVVIDYDGGGKRFFEPANLDDPAVLIRGGLDPSESDPRFHQQMVYAVASETLERFEMALGRKIHWRRPVKESLAGKGEYARRLRLFPHAMPQANAFYSPDAHGILFGYFTASRTDPGQNLPGQTVFTCLSHDIIAHETTHAIIDGIRSYLTEPTNIDVPAFHEAFADLVALFRHFSHKEVLLDTLQKTGGQLYQFQLKPEAASEDGQPVAIQPQLSEPNPLIQLAKQFGEASGMHSGLRSALGTPPNSDDIKKKTEPHDRGSILVAAVFDAYFTIYTRRTAALFRVFRSAGGIQKPIDLPTPLAELLAAEASRTADKFFVLCARSLDYCPPVDLTFGDFLRALITAHLDLDPIDPDGVRDALMQAFRLRGIVPKGAQYFSEDSLCWPKVSPGAMPPVEGLVFGDPNGLTDEEKDKNGDILRAYVNDPTNRKKLGFASEAVAVPSFHPVFRTESNGSLSIDMVVEAVQSTDALLDASRPDIGTFSLRCGVTLVIAKGALELGQRQSPYVRYAVAKLHTAERESTQRTMYSTYGVADPSQQGKRFQIDFCLLHAGA